MPLSSYFLRVLVAIGAAFLFANGCATANDSNNDQRIIAIGDLHGDYDAYRAILSAAGLIDEDGKWSGGDTILVQTGDIPDRGPDTKRIIEEIQKLQRRAKRKGGKVITLIGNHEAMNIVGDLRYVHPGEYEAFVDNRSEALRDSIFEANRRALKSYHAARGEKLTDEEIRDAWIRDWPLGKVEHRRAWRPTDDIGSWVAGNDAVAKVGGVLFVHGGLSAEYSILSIDIMNDRVRDAIRKEDNSETSILFDQLGPLWYRGLVRRPPPPAAAEDAAGETPGAVAPARPGIAEEVEIVLNAFDAERIVMGHTPSITGIKATQGGRVIQIDTGASAYYGGVSAYLEIKDGVVTAHNVTTGESRIISLTEEE